jgi:phosphoglycerate kinase
VEKRVSLLKDGDALLLENLRFHAEEEKNDPEFSKRLAGLADIYVNDAFAASHRAHASVKGITRFAPICAAGYQLQKEMKYFKKVMDNPVRPLGIVAGGAKVSTKMGLLENLVPKVDYLMIGGAMANTFLKAEGKDVGKSLTEPEYIEIAKRLIESANKRGVKVLLPVDAVVSVDGKTDVRQVIIDGDLGEAQIFDIGPRSVQLFESALQKCKTIFWNGPMGVFETPPFDKGTFALAEFLGSIEATTVIGGGDLTAAVRQAGVEGKLSYVSTGGGAFLKLLEGKALPGITALEECEEREKRN